MKMAFCCNFLVNPVFLIIGNICSSTNICKDPDFPYFSAIPNFIEISRVFFSGKVSPGY